MAVRALARVNLAAIERNVARLRARLTARSGAVRGRQGRRLRPRRGRKRPARRSPAARGWLAVATAAEAAELRDGGRRGAVLVMGALSAEELPVALAARADARRLERAVRRRARARRGAGSTAPVRVHVKLDTGMGRLGTREPAEALRVADAVAGGARRSSSPAR